MKRSALKSSIQSVKELIHDAHRIVIEAVKPSVDDGRFAAKHIVGEIVEVGADVYMDTQDQLAVDLLWRCNQSDSWEASHMTAVGNDRWVGRLALQETGIHEFVIESWHDSFGTYRNHLIKKIEAGNNVELEIEEGYILIKDAITALKKTVKKEQEFERKQPEDFYAINLENLQKLSKVLLNIKTSNCYLTPDEVKPSEALLAQLAAYSDQQRASLVVLLADFTSALMSVSEPRDFLTRSQIFPVRVERRAAEFASWYEMFPRSQSGKPNEHGTFEDVVNRLPAISQMGFDTIYFTPIHPIGKKNRKGKNNSLIAEPLDPGSPYAIGSDEGGHDAIHPELGTWDDFRHMRDEAKKLGIEIALDFAIQCAPDHPWLSDHPEWFNWRPDGTVKHAENPPKKYQDIVGVNFYAPKSTPQLWIALRDIVLLWAKEGVRVFRVDNPHTKPLPFWEWMISEVQAEYPDTIFLSEAFTTPKMMYRLAKVGFTQSYTYFTWRNYKQEIIDYLTQLLSGDVPEYFRPHFFVNTPDINPFYLQSKGREGFLVRAVVAATMSGLWGISSGFEICESAAVPEKEEFINSEKYEIRAWDWNRPGNIIHEISLLNKIRKAYPQLQTHLGLTFHYTDNNNVLFYSKAGKRLPGQPIDSLILVAVNLEPQYMQDTALEVPLYLLGLDDNASINVHDLVSDTHFTWQGKWQRARLDPQQYLFVIWHVTPAAI